MDRCTICNSLCDGDTCPACKADIRRDLSEIEDHDAYLHGSIEHLRATQRGPATYDPDNTNVILLI